MSEDLVKLGIRRRSAILRLGAAAAAAVVVPGVAPNLAHGQPAPAKPVRGPLDPDLTNPEVPWPKVLTRDELATVAALIDVMLPADDRSPAASALGVHDFVDEWIGAPYPIQQADRLIVRGGLGWLDTEAGRRFGRRFSKLTSAQKLKICDEVADGTSTTPQLAPGARLFDRVRFIAMLGVYTTPEGSKDMGYVGNTPSATWDGPSEAVLRHLKMI
jgi:hypothetical protein